MLIEYKIGDCRSLLKSIRTQSIDLVVTSPPYNIGKNYGTYSDSISFDDWKKLITDVGKQIFRVLTPSGAFFLNLSPIPGPNKEIIPLPYIAYPIMKEIGFMLRNSIIWTFNNMQNCTKRLSGRWETIQWWVKDLDNYVFNLDKVRIPYITQGDKRIERRGGIGRNPTDVWYFNRINNMTKKKLGLDHPTIYPLQMIERIITMASKMEDTVLDPFLGSGTTLVAAINLSRNAIGFEIDEKYCSLIQKRVEQESIIQEDLEFNFNGPQFSKIISKSA